MCHTVIRYNTSSLIVLPPQFLQQFIALEELNPKVLLSVRNDENITDTMSRKKKTRKQVTGFVFSTHTRTHTHTHIYTPYIIYLHDTVTTYFHHFQQLLLE
jgi:hypothetical protein